jgi:hypothetical protein
MFSAADVALDRPERYGKQLASHLGHKVPVAILANGWALTIGEGTGRVLPADGILRLEAEADSPELLARIQDVLERHLRKFATKAGDLDVTWTP